MMIDILYHDINYVYQFALLEVQNHLKTQYYLYN
jgi:hypothetical protein